MSATDFTFVHAADLHLDSPFVGLGRQSNPHVQAALVDATFAAFDAVVALCERVGADALLIAGDVFDADDRSLRAEHRFRERLSALAARGIPSFVVHGNHDPLSPGSTRGWGAGVHVFGGRVSSVPLRRGGLEVARIHGISFTRREVVDNLALRFRRGTEPFAIGLLHTNVDGDTDHRPYAPCTLSDLTTSGFDYWALGHVHAPSVLRRADPLVVYAGTPQGRHRKERGPRGCLVVRVRGGVPEPEFVPLDVVRWEAVEVTIEGLDDATFLVGRITDELRARRHAAGRSLVACLRISGEGPVHRALAVPGCLDDVLRDVERDLTDEGGFVVVESVTVATRPPVAARASRTPTIAGEVREIAGEILAGDGVADRVSEAIRDVERPLADVRRRYAPTGAELEVVVSKAADLAVELLESDE